MREGAMKNMRVHMIADDDLMNDLPVATKLVPVPSVIADLKAAVAKPLERRPCVEGILVGRPRGAAGRR